MCSKSDDRGAENVHDHRIAEDAEAGDDLSHQGDAPHLRPLLCPLPDPARILLPLPDGQTHLCSNRTKLCQITLIYQIMHHIAVLVICSKHHECAMVHCVQDHLDFVDGCQAGVKMIIQGDHLASALAQ